MHTKAVLFDLDGTLLDTLADLGNAVNRMLQQHGFAPHRLDDYRHFVGDGAKMLIRRALPQEHRSESFIQSCLDEYLTDYQNNWHVHTCLYSGIAAMLDDLNDRSVALAIVSNKPHVLTERCTRAFLGKWPFQVVLGQKAEMPKKPDPTGALLVARQLDVPPASCVFVGDSGVDMQTAVAAGMYPVGVSWGFRPEAELRKHGARLLLHHPVELTAEFDPNKP